MFQSLRQSPRNRNRPDYTSTSVCVAASGARRRQPLPEQTAAYKGNSARAPPVQQSPVVPVPQPPTFPKGFRELGPGVNARGANNVSIPSGPRNANVPRQGADARVRSSIATRKQDAPMDVDTPGEVGRPDTYRRAHEFPLQRERRESMDVDSSPVGRYPPAQPQRRDTRSQDILPPDRERSDDKTFLPPKGPRAMATRNDYPPPPSGPASTSTYTNPNLEPRVPALESDLNWQGRGPPPSPHAQRRGSHSKWGPPPDGRQDPTRVPDQSSHPDYGRPQPERSTTSQRTETNDRTYAVHRDLGPPASSTQVRAYSATVPFLRFSQRHRSPSPVLRTIAARLLYLPNLVKIGLLRAPPTGRRHRA